jgi:ABC-type Fe3+/spermidine/putrescine transport system ATPase subunit
MSRDETAAMATNGLDQPTGGHAESLVSVRGLRVRFGQVAALDGIDLEIGSGDFVTLLGPSGSGKTTLLRVIAGFAQPDAGDVLILGRSILGDAPERRPVNTVFQHYALFPHLSVWRNVAFGLEVARVPRQLVRERVVRTIEMVRLDGLESRRVDELSGGQQQRVALARAVVNRPSVLLLDEPLGALDLKLRHEMQLELRALQRELDMTFLYVTHDQEEALVLSDMIAVMRDGRIAQIGPPIEIYRRPMSRFVAEFIGETNVLAGAAERGVVWLDSVAARLPAPDACDGPVLVSVRPEDIRVGADGQVALNGTVTDAVFLGADIRLSVRVDNALSLVVLGRHLDSGAPLVGGTVRLSWSYEDCAVIPP